MEVSQTVNLYITFVEKEGPFLKVWGQTEKSNSIYVEQFLLGTAHQFDLGVGKVSVDNLQVGTLVCAKYKDNKYYRARITNVSFVREGFVEVSFLDYGNKDLVPCGNVRSLQNFPTSFISIPPLATGFIFAEAHCPGGGEWNETIFENISKEVKYREVQCTLLIQATQYFLVKLFIGGNDLCGILINRGLMQPISLQAQQAVLLSMSMQRQSAPQLQSTALPSTGINTYKACTLEPGCLYPVYVSYVNDGPCHFSVQLKQSEEVLVMLMNDINLITLRLLEDIPIPGTICLARCQEDGNICRAVVTNEVDNQFKVFYVDFGNYEVVPLDALYQIPFKYVLPKVMAIRFALAGVEKSTVTIEMQCAFKQFVDNRLLHMKVLPTPTRMAIPKCELWDPETKTSALDVVKRAAQNAYPEPVSLNRGFSQPVKVSYVYSCNRFYVQLVNKENELLKLMLDLQASCQTNEPMDLSNIKVGLPCCALFISDQQWYRSQIVEVLGDNVKVRYIDYGNEEEVPGSQLKIIDGEHLTVLRPQAIECCLNGYQNMEEDQERDGFLEELILEGQFTMKVVEMTNKKALVELFDNSNYNIASLLLDKLATAKSQVSPMLVQAGNKIEHRKSVSHQNGPRDPNFRNDRKPGRDNKNYDRTNDRNDKSWRQENKDFRSHDKNSNESVNEKSSWRQNNRGFSPNNERYNRDKTRSFSNNNSSWDTINDKPQTSNDNWSTPPNNIGSQNNSRENDFGRNKGRFDNDKGNWNSGAPKGGGFKKRNDFRKDGSEVSSSGSEKSFHKGPRTSSRNDRNDRPKYPNKFDKPRNTSFNSTGGGGDSWNVSVVTPPIDAAPATAKFVPYDVVGTESKVIISWFHNPGHFYCQLADIQSQFKTMMEEIQQFYKTRKPEITIVGAPIIGLFPEDNVLYRAQVLETIGSQYKVYYVDFGNVSTISKVWPIEKKFMSLPAQAIVCSLSGVAPPGDKWPDPDNYSKYFDKDTFTCRFVDKDEEKTYVNLLFGEDDITPLLIQNGLAVSIQPTIPDIEIPLLFGQQFRAVIMSINNLSDIIIAIECGLAISCQMHNLETATETYEETLKGLLEQTVIVYVDNVIDDRLEVTLYDTEGSKLVIVNPDEGAYDSVEALCPPLILRSTLTGYVSHVNASSVFIQPTDYVEIIPYLLQQMFDFYEEQPLDLPIIPEEGLLYAVHGQDGNWYRAKVVTFDDEQATVTYVDYGNSESVEFSALRELADTFLETCTLCVEVNANADAGNFIDKDVVATISYGEKGWEGSVELQVPGESSATESEFAEKDNSAIETTPQMQEESTNKIADVEGTETIQEVVQEIDNVQVSAEAEEIIDLTKDTASAEIISDSPAEYVAPLKGIQVVVSHVDTPNEFYLQLAESLNAINELQSHLQEEVTNMPVLETPTAGILCAAPYSGDQQWYRAEVLDADDDITTVRFVDYGNTDVIDNKTTQIKTLPPNLLSLAVYATRSSLKITATDEEWSTNVIERFDTLVNASELSAEFIDQDEKTNYVELYVDGQNIKDILIQENLGVPVELSLESKSTCFVSHLNSPSEFWIQLENCIDELEWIAEQLSGAEKFSELEDLTPGTLCAALFPDDEMWYRARILSNTVAGLELLFIDYGNSCTSNSLRQLPEDLVVTPPLAQKCSLQKPDEVLYWSLQAVNKFNDISAGGQTIFTVRKISTGETSVVQLLLDGEDVASMLLPITEDGYVKDVESLENFHIEKDGEVLPDNYKLEAMPGMTWNEESTEKFKELNPQGVTLFQIEFLSENTVRLYLNRSDIRLSLGGIKIALLNASKTDVDDKTDKVDDSIYLNKTEDDIDNEETNDLGENNSNVCDVVINDEVDIIEDQVKSPELIVQPDTKEESKTESNLDNEIVSTSLIVKKTEATPTVDSKAESTSNIQSNTELTPTVESKLVSTSPVDKKTESIPTVDSEPESTLNVDSKTTDSYIEMGNHVESLEENNKCESASTIDEETSQNKDSSENRSETTNEILESEKIEATAILDSEAESTSNIQSKTGSTPTVNSETESTSDVDSKTGDVSIEVKNDVESEKEHYKCEAASTVDEKTTLNKNCSEIGSKDTNEIPESKKTEAAATIDSKSASNIHSKTESTPPVDAKTELTSPFDKKMESTPTVDSNTESILNIHNKAEDSSIEINQVDSQEKSNKYESASVDEKTSLNKDCSEIRYKDTNEIPESKKTEATSTVDSNTESISSIRKKTESTPTIAIKTELTSNYDSKTEVSSIEINQVESQEKNNKCESASTVEKTSLNKDSSEKISENINEIPETRSKDTNEIFDVPNNELDKTKDELREKCISQNEDELKLKEVLEIPEASQINEVPLIKESIKSKVEASELTQVTDEQTKPPEKIENRLSGDTTESLHEETEKTLNTTDDVNSETKSRPSSSCSGRIKHDDRILPGAVSRPHTPIDDSLSVDDSKDELEGISGSEVAHILKDLINDALDKQDDVEVKSRPQSSGSGKISYDDRIVPAALSRSHSPLECDDKES